MDANGYSFQTQEKLKAYCKKNRINLDLEESIFTEAEHGKSVDHDRVLEVINYCSLGDYGDSVAFVLEFHRFLNDRRMSYGRRKEFLKYFLRTHLISLRKYLECDKHHEVQVFRGALDRIRHHIEVVYDPDLNAIDEYMKIACKRYKEDSNALIEEFNTLKKQL